MYTQIATLKSLLLLCVLQTLSLVVFAFAASASKRAKTRPLFAPRAALFSVFSVHLGLNHLAIVLDAI